MANNKDFKVKNGIQPTVYHEAVGTVVSGSEGYYLSGLSSSNKSASVSEDGTPIGSHISSDGTKLYMIGNATDTVYQYDMSTANDLSTATYNSVSLNVNGDGATSPKGITFKPDGTKMYVLDSTIVFEYYLSTAWDLSTASFTTGDSYDTTAETGNCRGIQFTSDGLTMYVGDINPTDAIYQYTLSTAWQVNTASYASKSLNVITTGYGEFAFNADGTLLWVMANTGVVTEYSLTTAYDISTGTASGNTYDFSATVGSGIYMFHLFDSGTKVAVGGSTDDTLHQFDITLNNRTLDLSTGSVFEITPTSDVEVTVSNPAASGTVSAATLLLGGYAVGPADTFSTTTYSGNGATQTITNNIDLATDGGLVWTKKRSGSSATSNVLHDSARTITKGLITDSNGAEIDYTVSGVTSFNSSGYVIGTGNAWNNSDSTYVSWTFKKASNFFDVVTYTGDGTSGQTINHNLGSVPAFMIVKRTDSTGNWTCYHHSLNGGSSPESYRINLNQTSGSAGPNASYWNNTAPTSTQFTVGSDLNITSATFVVYLFAHDTSDNSSIKCGSYTGDGLIDGPQIDLGWEPQWLLVKRTDSTANWYITDNKRGFAGSSGQPTLSPNLSDAESGSNVLTANATGWKIDTNSGIYNAENGNYIYVAIREPEPTTITYDTTLEWSGGTAPTSPATGETDVITISTRDGGTTYQAALSIDGAK